MGKLYHILNALGVTIAGFVSVVGRCTAWLSIALVCITCVVVVLRYGFGIGAIALQETALYIYAALFMLGAAYTLGRDGHVRVDVFYRRFTSIQRAWVNIVGGLFLLVPTALGIILLSWEFVAQAWVNREGSIQSEGLPFVYLLKSMIPMCGGLLLLQGIANLIDNTLVLVGAKTQSPMAKTDEVVL
jgi:TRAP-type mannitol/chloroaromatic compound transport system permease small subunit